MAKCKDSCNHGPDAKFHGTAGGYTNHGCKCDDCRNAQKAYINKTCPSDCQHHDDSEWHGTRQGYKYHKCRCSLCENSQGAKGRKNCADGCVHTADAKWHGGRTGYRYHQCRCEKCATGYKASRVGRPNHCNDSCVHTGLEDWHGSNSGYNWHFCRCDLCRNASNDISLTRNQETRLWVKRSKDKACMDCGIKYPCYAMDYDHRDPSTKSFSLNQPGGRSLDLIKKEIEKCDLVCANCHAIRTWPKGKDISKMSERRKLIAQGKDKPCMDCNMSYPLCVMHYDHVDPSSKLFNVSRPTGHSLEEIQIEMTKCRILCSNCHRIKTHGTSDG